MTGIIGIILMLLGITQHFETWITVLGALYTPIIGIGIVHYSIAKKRGKERLNIDGIISWATGCLVGIISNEPGINLIFAEIIAAMTYGFLLDLKPGATYRKYFKTVKIEQ